MSIIKDIIEETKEVASEKLDLLEACRLGQVIVKNGKYDDGSKKIIVCFAYNGVINPWIIGRVDTENPEFLLELYNKRDYKHNYIPITTKELIENGAISEEIQNDTD